MYHPTHPQVSFTEIQPLLDKIRNTNIWMSDGPKMQFALATLTLPLPLPLTQTLPLPLLLTRSSPRRSVTRTT